MEWYLQLGFYLFGIGMAFVALWQVDFNKFMRLGRKQFALLVYIILAVVLGFLLGKAFIDLADLFRQAIK